MAASICEKDKRADFAVSLSLSGGFITRGCPMEHDPDLVLRCEGIHRFLGEDENSVHVLKDVSLQLHTRLIYSIMGPSGCGKSTLLYLLGLLDRPDSGSLWISGQEVSGLDDQELSLFRNREIGFVFQFHFLLKEFSALENVQLPMRQAGNMTRKEMDERGSQLLELVGLEDKIHRNAHHLSGGEQQRVADCAGAGQWTAAVAGR